MKTEDEYLTLLLGRAKAGDREAFDEVTSSIRERLVSFVRSRLGQLLKGKVDPEDVVQEALLKAFESIHAFRGTDGKSLWSWLTSISEHLVCNASRRRSVKESALSVDKSGDDVSPSRGLRREERLDRLEKSLAKLQPEQREIIILAKIEGLKARDIALRLRQSEASVRQAISRGLKQLRVNIGDTESLHLPDRELGRRPEDAL